MIKKTILIIAIFIMFSGCGGIKETRIRGIWQFWQQDKEKGLIFHKYIIQPSKNRNGAIELKIINKNDFDVQIKFRLKVYCLASTSYFTESEELKLLIPKLIKPNDTFGYIKINIKGKDFITDIAFSEFSLSRI